MTKFFIVGTPIGNFDDITLRAIETLKKVDIIACEDTRVTKNLLTHFSIYDKKLISYHKYNETISSQKIIDILLNENKSVALVSDAGMPTISDPGFVLVESIKKHNISFEVIPGVSAITTIMAISGFGPDFTFLGFGKMKKSQLENQIKNLTEGTYLFFCAPNKMEFLISTIEKYHKDSSALDLEHRNVVFLFISDDLCLDSHLLAVKPYRNRLIILDHVVIRYYIAVRGYYRARTRAYTRRGSCFYYDHRA